MPFVHARKHVRDRPQSTEREKCFAAGGQIEVAANIRAPKAAGPLGGGLVFEAEARPLRIGPDQDVVGLQDQVDRIGGQGLFLGQVPVANGNPTNPQTMSLDFVLRYWARRGVEQALAIVSHSFKQMSNGGIYDSLMSTPILNPPQSGILGMHKIERRPVAVSDKVEIRPMMYVALSYDHRIVDGREAVTFLVRIKECVEDPSRILFDM